MSTALHFENVSVIRDETVVLQHLDWTIKSGERWVILGPNGSGKTTMLKLASAQLHPSGGVVQILGSTMGRVDVRELRKRIGFVGGAFTRAIRADQATVDVVMAGKFAALETWWDEFTEADAARARRLLEDLGVGGIADRPYAVVSEGERQQVMLARTLMGSPELLLFDEPFAGLDLGARERLLKRLETLFCHHKTPASVLVTHHAEEIPPGVTHVGLLRDGRWTARGPIAETLTSSNVSACFGLRIEMTHAHDRWTSRAN